MQALMTTQRLRLWVLLVAGAALLGLIAFVAFSPASTARGDHPGEALEFEDCEDFSVDNDHDLLLPFEDPDCGPGGPGSGGPPPDTLIVVSGVVEDDGCFITVQKDLEGARPVFDDDIGETVFTELEFIHVISACASEDDDDTVVQSTVETFIIRCTRTESLGTASCEALE